MSFISRNHPQQVEKRGAFHVVDDRATTPEVFAPLHERFGFTIDVAASASNTKLPRFYSIEDNGLTRSWSGERVWCNPPYSNIRPWVEKAQTEAWNYEPVELVVMLLPANRTEQAWWQDLIEPARLAGEIRVEFLRGRMRFLAPDEDTIQPNSRPPFGVCLVIWGGGRCSSCDGSGYASDFEGRCFGTCRSCDGVGAA